MKTWISTLVLFVLPFAAFSESTLITVKNHSSGRTEVRTQGGFDADVANINHVMTLTIETSPLFKKADIEWFFVAKTIPGKARYIFDAGGRVGVGAHESFDVTANPLSESAVTNKDLLLTLYDDGSLTATPLAGATEKSGSKLEGWIVRSGKDIWASLSELKDMAERNPSALSAAEKAFSVPMSQGGEPIVAAASNDNPKPHNPQTINEPLPVRGSSHPFAGVFPSDVVTSSRTDSDFNGAYLPIPAGARLHAIRSKGGGLVEVSMFDGTATVDAQNLLSAPVYSPPKPEFAGLADAGSISMQGVSSDAGVKITVSNSDNRPVGSITVTVYWTRSGSITAFSDQSRLIGSKGSTPMSFSAPQIHPGWFAVVSRGGLILSGIGSDAEREELVHNRWARDMAIARTQP